MEWLKVSDIADRLGISKVATYKRIKGCKPSLNPYIKKINGIMHVSSDGFNRLKEIAVKIKSPENSSQTTPAVNHFKLQGLQNELKEVYNSRIKFLESQLQSQQETFNLMVKTHAEEKVRTDTIIMSLTKKITSLQVEHQKNEKSIPDYEISSQPDHINTEKDFVVQASILNKLVSGINHFFIEIFNPVSLRKNP